MSGVVRRGARQIVATTGTDQRWMGHPLRSNSEESSTFMRSNYEWLGRAC